MHASSMSQRDEYSGIWPILSIQVLLHSVTGGSMFLNALGAGLLAESNRVLFDFTTGDDVTLRPYLKAAKREKQF